MDGGPQEVRICVATITVALLQQKGSYEICKSDSVSQSGTGRIVFLPADCRRKPMCGSSPVGSYADLPERSTIIEKVSVNDNVIFSG